MARRDYAGGAAATTISSGINATDLTITITSGTNWPQGTNGKFFVAIDRGLSSEEKILVLSRSGTTLTVASTGDRGVDGTTAQSHSSGATIEHVGTATDLDDANAHINDTSRDDHTQYLNTTTSAGNGLTIAGRVLAVNVDNSTLEINSDTVRQKDAGTTNAKLANMAQATIKGRASGAGTGAPTDLDAAAARTALGLGSLATKSAVGTGDITDGTILYQDINHSNGTLPQFVLAAGHPGSPTYGDMIIELDTAKTLFYYGPTTVWQPVWNTAWGEIGSATRSSSQTGISTITDLTGLSVSVTTVANRRIKISAIVPVQQITGAGVPQLTIRDGGGATLQTINFPGSAGAGDTAMLAGFVRLTTTAATTTYKLSLSTSANTVNTICAAGVIGHILVEDIGSNGVPA